jgi:hypothetical protein
MRHQIKILMFCLFLFPCSAFACLFSYCTGDSFKQPEIYISNHSSQAIIFTDANGSTVTTAPDDGTYMTFPVDLVNDSIAQIFSHSVDIRSAVDFKLICTIKTTAVITNGAAKLSDSVSTDESKCGMYPHVLFDASAISGMIDAIGEGVEVKD